jgi:hypothetical protein
MVIRNPSGYFVSVGREMSTDKTEHDSEGRTILGLTDSRVHFSRAIIFSLNSEAHTYGSLVTHIQWTTSCPLRLDIANVMGYTAVKRINEQSDANVHYLCHKRVSLPIWSMRL